MGNTPLDTWSVSISDFCESFWSGGMCHESRSSLFCSMSSRETSKSEIPGTSYRKGQ